MSPGTASAGRHADAAASCTRKRNAAHRNPRAARSWSFLVSPRPSYGQVAEPPLITQLLALPASQERSGVGQPPRRDRVLRHGHAPGAGAPLSAAACSGSGGLGSSR